MVKLNMRIQMAMILVIIKVSLHKVNGTLRKSMIMIIMKIMKGRLWLRSKSKVRPLLRMWKFPKLRKLPMKKGIILYKVNL
jgi:hypothetical protein